MIKIYQRKTQRQREKMGLFPTTKKWVPKFVSCVCVYVYIYIYSER
jgi:hypothetical protein